MYQAGVHNLFKRDWGGGLLNTERQRREERKQQPPCRLQGLCGFQVSCRSGKYQAARGSDRGGEG